MLLRPSTSSLLRPAAYGSLGSTFVRSQNSSYVPAPLPGAAALYLPGVGVTGTLNASQWDDQSGNGRHLKQATGANQPIYLPFTGEKYGWLPGVSGNYFSTPDAAALDLTGDMDFRVKVALDDYTPAITQALIGKEAASTLGRQSYLFYLTSSAPAGRLAFRVGTASGLSTDAVSPVLGLTDGTTNWLRVTWRQSDGRTQFFTSTDGVSWTQVGTDQTTGAGATVSNSDAAVEVGSRFIGTALNTAGKIYRAQLYNGIDGTLVADFDPSRWTSGTTFTDSTGKVWTINSTGSKPAQIVDGASLLFDGSAHYMSTDAFTLNQPETAYLLGRQISWSSVSPAKGVLAGVGAGNGSLAQTGTTPGVAAVLSTSTAANTSWTVGSYAVVSAVVNGASSLVQVNGGTPATGDVGSSNGMGGFRVGTNAGVSAQANIQVRAAALYPAAHDATQRRAMIRWLASMHSGLAL